MDRIITNKVVMAHQSPNLVEIDYSNQHERKSIEKATNTNSALVKLINLR